MVQWFVDGRKNFTGPRVNIESMVNGEVQGMDPWGEDGGKPSGSSDGKDVK